jgi:hypothetical protein
MKIDEDEMDGEAQRGNGQMSGNMRTQSRQKENCKNKK